MCNYRSYSTNQNYLSYFILCSFIISFIRIISGYNPIYHKILHKFVLEKVNEVLMDLESIRQGKLDYRSRATTIEVNTTKKQMNRLCMYGLPPVQKNLAQKRSVSLKLTTKDKKLSRTVSFIAKFF